MSERVSPAVRVRAVKGRTIDPFRGTPSEDAEADRLASRAVDAQPIDDVAATLERLPGVKIARAGRRFTIGRGHDVIRVAFASAARRVSLDDATFEGDGNLVITALHALLPLFGAVEVRMAGGYSDVIDGHEPLAKVLERYDAWWIEESLKLAKQMRERDAAAAPKQTARAPYTSVAPGPVRAPVSWRRKLVFGAIVAALAIAMVVAIKRGQKAELGEYCTENAECDSDSCLPREPMPVSASARDFELRTEPPPRPFDPSGVCTTRCTSDSDCPTDMTCGPVMSYGHSINVRTSSCIPRLWH